MKRVIFICNFLIISLMMVFGQKPLKVEDWKLDDAIIRAPEPNTTIVGIKSTIPLNFESTMDKTVDIVNTNEESGFLFYYIKFTVEKKYRGRRLKIKSDGFNTYVQPLELKANEFVGYYIFDPNGTVGVGCYFEHLNKGNNFFENTQYADAKAEYYLALECSDIPEDNDLSKKIEDSGTCLDAKRDADDFYNSGKFADALQKYEKVYAVNPQDRYTKERINLCNEKIANLPRQIRGKVTASENGSALADVSIKAEYYKLDKKGKIKTNKDGVRETEWRDVGKTDYNGKFEITVLNQTKNLKFYKRTEESLDGSSGNNATSYNSSRDNSTSNTSTASAIIDGLGMLANTVAKTMKYHYSGTASITSDEVDIALEKKAGL